MVNSALPLIISAASAKDAPKIELYSQSIPRFKDSIFKKIP